MSLAVEWVWNGALQSPSHPATCMTPLVVQLTDDNLDGRIDQDDGADVVFSHFGNEALPALITALDGRTGAELWTSPGPPVEWPYLAAGDIDGDGVVEILGTEGALTRLVAFEHDGTFKWRGTAGLISQWDAIGVADFDQDGTPEIYSGRNVFRNTGGVRSLGTAGRGAGARGATSNALDLDPASPGLELLAGNTLYAANGSVLWQHPILEDGYTAVADFDHDGIPEILLAAPWDVVHMLDPSGNVLTPSYAIAGGISQPAIADVDGDGDPEIVLVVQDRIEVVEWSPAGFARKWYQPTTDVSALAGPSIYDIDGDGAAEILYHDEHQLMIFDGASGVVLAAVPFATGTGNEVPVVADLDGDCQAEVLIGGCIAARGAREELVAYELTPSVPPRAMWNQAGYHVTNVNDDGSIPRYETANWNPPAGWMQQAGVTLPRATAVAASVAPLCLGDSATLDGAPSLGCSPLDYRWLLAGAPVCDWSATPTCVVAPNTTTTYTLEAICAGVPCALSDATFIQVEVLPPPVATAGADVAVCELLPTLLDASASTDPGCSGGLLFEWSEGATIVRPAATDPTYAPPTATPGTYTYTVSAACALTPGCDASDDVTVAVVPTPIPVAGPDVSVCEQAALQLDASASVDRGCPGGLLFEWREGATVLRPASTDPTYVPVTSTAGSRTYTVVTLCAGVNRCDGVDDVTVAVVPAPITVAGPDVSACEQASLQLDASASVDRGCPGGVLFEWREGATVLRPASTDPTYVPATSAPGTRTYTVETRCAGATGCGTTDDVDVTVRACPLAVVFAALEAKRVGSTAEIRWRTAAELDTVLFQLERAASAAGPFTATGPSLAAHGPGLDYVARDADPPSQAWYRVVEHTANGRGDVSAAVSPANTGAGQRRRRGSPQFPK